MEDTVGWCVHIHPVALFTVVDSYERRQESSKRVIGTLLGSREKGVVEIRSGYSVPHNETEEEVAVDMDFNSEMLKLHQRVNPNEAVVGWYSTSPEVTMHSVLVHDYYSRLDPNAVFVIVDTSLKSGRLDIKAHVRSKVGLPGKTEGTIFTPLLCEVVYFEPERVGVEMLQQVKQDSCGIAPVLSDFMRIERAADAIDQMLEKLLEYVEDIIAGKIPPNSTVGRLLMETVSHVPKFDGPKFDAMLNSTMQDLLMVVYLANLTKTQLTLGESLQHIPS